MSSNIYYVHNYINIEVICEKKHALLLLSLSDCSITLYGFRLLRNCASCWHIFGRPITARMKARWV